MVCGFVAPPDKFQDPDVDMAKQVDLRAKDQGQLGAGDVPGLNMDTNDADGDGLDDNTGEPVDEEQAGLMDQQPMLICPNCGFEVEGGEPVSTNTAMPQGGDAGTGPVEGDLCPACGQAPLESGNQLAEQGELPPEADGQPDADPEEVEEKVADDEQDPPPFEKGDPEDPDADPEREEDDGEEEDNDEEEDPDPRNDPRKNPRRPM